MRRVVLLLFAAVFIVMSAAVSTAGAHPACTIAGTHAKDVLRGTPGRDVICGRGSFDVIHGGGGNDLILGGAATDKIWGGSGVDRIVGGPGDDKLAGEQGQDELDGNGGDDTLLGGPAGDHVDGGQGKDSCDQGDPNDVDVSCNDHAGPIFLSLQLPFNEILDARNSDVEIPITVSASDALSGVSSVSIKLFDSSDGLKTIPLDPSGVAPNSGKFTTTLVFPRGSTGRDLEVQEIDLVDNAGNESSFTEEQLQEHGVMTLISIGGRTPPGDPHTTISGLSFSPSTIDTSQGSVPVNVSVHLDSLPGARMLILGFRSPADQGPPDPGSFGGLAAAPLFVRGGTHYSGTFVGTIFVPKDTPTGELKPILTLDNQTLHTYQPADLAAMGDTATVLQTGPGDSTPPKLESFQISPRTVDVDTGAHSVAMSLHATDDLAGLSHFAAQLCSPQGDCMNANGSFNGRRNDSVTTDFAIPGDAGLGDYTISGLQLSDGATNKVHYDAAALAGMGFDPTVHVVGTPDTQPPQLTALRVDPATVDTSRGEHAVDVTASATDDRRGVKSITVSVGDASGNLWSSDGTPESGDWENRINLAQFSGPSELPISVKLIDREGNERDYTSEQLAAAGLPSVVHETGPADTTPPTLTGFELSPTHVDTASQDQLVQVVVDGSDDISGSNLAWIYLRFPTGDTESFGAGFNDNGDSNDSLAHPSFDLPQGSPLGEYEIYRVELTDRAGNTAVFDNSNGLDGYPVTFQNGP